MGDEDGFGSDEGERVGGVLAYCYAPWHGVRGLAEIQEVEGSGDAVQLVYVPVSCACYVSILWSEGSENHEGVL